MTFLIAYPTFRLHRLGGGEAGSTGSRIGVPSLLVQGFGREWSGQTVSLSLSGQNWRMESYKYHCRSMLSPNGVTTADNSSTAMSMAPSCLCFICQKINLARESFAGYTKHCALPRRKEVEGARLKRIGGIVHLLCEVKRLVDLHVAGSRAGWRWSKQPWS